MSSTCSHHCGNSQHSKVQPVVWFDFKVVQQFDIKSHTLRKRILKIALNFQSLLSRISQGLARREKQEGQRFISHVLAFKQAPKMLLICTRDLIKGLLQNFHFGNYECSFSLTSESQGSGDLSSHLIVSHQSRWSLSWADGGWSEEGWSLKRLFLLELADCRQEHCPTRVSWTWALIRSKLVNPICELLRLAPVREAFSFKKKENLHC